MFGGLFDQDAESGVSGDQHTGQSPACSRQSSGYVVISVGGSCVVGETIETGFLRELSELVSRMHASGRKIVLVVGGGSVARDYIDAGKEIGGEKYFLDQVGIHATRLNASLVIHAVPETYPRVLSGLDSADEVLAIGKVPVFGGVLPGATTDYVACLLAEKFFATFINISSVDGVYNKDPKKSRKPKMFQTMSHEKLLEVVQKNSREPGANTVLDVFAAMVLMRSNIEAVFVSGKNMGGIGDALNGLDFAGTRVTRMDL